MSNSEEIIERIQKYEGVEKFMILNKNGNKIEPNIKGDDDKGKTVMNNFNNNFGDIPKLLEKAVSAVRDINPLVNFSILIL